MTSLALLDRAGLRPADLVTAAAVGALTLVDPARLSVGRRALYRGAVGTLGGATVWQTLRDDDAPLGTEARIGVSAGAAGMTYGLSELGEAFDRRLLAWLERSGVSRPRVLLATVGAALVLGGAAVEQRQRRARGLQSEAWSEHPEYVELPADVRDVVSALLSQTEDCDALRLRAQLDRATVASTFVQPDDVGAAFLHLAVPEDVPLAVPRDFTFPVVGRFVTERGVPCRLSLHVARGRISGLVRDIDEDLWPQLADEWDPGYGPQDPLADLVVWPSADDVEFVHDADLNRQAAS